MSGRIEISRELAERVVGWYDGGYGGTIIDEVAELRDLLAAPVVERQEPVAVAVALPRPWRELFEEDQDSSANGLARFSPDSYMQDEIDELRACLDKVKELNQ